MAAALAGAAARKSTVFSGDGPSRQPRRLRAARDRDAHRPAVRPRGLRAAPQRGDRLRDQDPPRRQRRGAGQVDPPGRALPRPPYGHVDRGTVAGPEVDHARRREGVPQGPLHREAAIQLGVAGGADEPFLDRARAATSPPCPAGGHAPPKLPSPAARRGWTSRSSRSRPTRRPSRSASRSTSPAATTTSTPWPSPTRTWASTGRSTAS